MRSNPGTRLASTSEDAASLEALASTLDQVHHLLAKAAGLLAPAHRPRAVPELDGTAGTIHAGLAGLVDRVLELKWAARDRLAGPGSARGTGADEGEGLGAEDLDEFTGPLSAGCLG